MKNDLIYDILLLMRDDYYFMLEAIKEANKAFEIGEVPIGAVIVNNGKIIARAYNQKETLKDTTAHAEILAIRRASEVLGSWRLTNCDLYVTIEPCVMCAGAISHARINRVIYGANDEKFGGCESLFQIPTDKRLNHRVNITKGIYEEDCLILLQNFFAQRR